jgi:methionyl-tRNA formyltransferase
MRLIFMGTPDFAVPALVALAEAGHEIVAAYTQPPRPGGRRGRELTPSPVQREAEARGIAVRHPVSLKGSEAQAEFAALNADLAVVAAYGLILPQAVLDAPRLGCLNIHASLLPRWRGAAPIHRAILAGDAETGVTIMRMEAGLDTGPMLAEGRTKIERKTAGELTAELARIGGEQIVRVLDDLAGFPEVAQPDEGVTYARKIDKVEARMDFAVSAEQLERQVRAFAPAPGAFFEFAGERFKVLAAEALRRPGLDSGPLASSMERSIKSPAVPGQARDDVSVVLDEALTIACGEGALRPTLIQRAGRPAMDAASLLRGFAIPVGTKLG